MHSYGLLRYMQLYASRDKFKPTRTAANGAVELKSTTTECGTPGCSKFETTPARLRSAQRLDLVSGQSVVSGSTGSATALISPEIVDGRRSWSATSR